MITFFARCFLLSLALVNEGREKNFEIRVDAADVAAAAIFYVVAAWFAIKLSVQV
jgi:hypothetical protein